MIDVYIRRSDEDFGLLLDEFHPDDLESLIIVIRNYGVYSGDVKYEFVIAQFVAEEHKVYFEIVVEPNED